MRLAAAVDGGNVWTSLDGGATWTDSGIYSIFVASNADGSKLVATQASGWIYTAE